MGLHENHCLGLVLGFGARSSVVAVEVSVGLCRRRESAVAPVGTLGCMARPGRPAWARGAGQLCAGSPGSVVKPLGS